MCSGVFFYFEILIPLSRSGVFSYFNKTRHVYPKQIHPTIIIIIIIITMVRLPYMGLGLLFPRLRGLCTFAAVRDRPTGCAFQLDPDVTARAIWQSVRRLG
jgi:hypothetical protein